MKKSQVVGLLAAIMLLGVLLVPAMASADAGLHVNVIRVATMCTEDKLLTDLWGDVTFTNDGTGAITADVILYVTGHEIASDEWKRTQENGDQQVIHIVDLQPGQKWTTDYRLTVHADSKYKSYRVENNFDPTKSRSVSCEKPNAVSVSAFSAAREEVAYWRYIAAFVILFTFIIGSLVWQRRQSLRRRRR